MAGAGTRGGVRGAAAGGVHHRKPRSLDRRHPRGSPGAGTACRVHSSSWHCWIVDLRDVLSGRKTLF